MEFDLEIRTVFTWISDPVTALESATARSGWFSLISSTLTAVVVGFASTILLIMEAARAVGATPAQQASWAAARCNRMAVTSFILSWRYRDPAALVGGLAFVGWKKLTLPEPGVDVAAPRALAMGGARRRARAGRGSRSTRGPARCEPCAHAGARRGAAGAAGGAAGQPFPPAQRRHRGNPAGAHRHDPGPHPVHVHALRRVLHDGRKTVLLDRRRNAVDQEAGGCGDVGFDHGQRTDAVYKQEHYNKTGWCIKLPHQLYF